ncbi:MAG: nucleoside triphosphate pyrophosphohydrolase [Actinomycetota bacterium]|nr:nucleoside triphosphate pyrophosphohydrolase [Actinomycetota bacterium]
MAALLRRECPWDRAQTAATIVPHTVEEAYEVADAVASGEDEKLVDELGDLLFQVYFLSLLLEERGAGDLETVARRAHDKLVRRHPHVFHSPGELGSPGEVKARWEELKSAQEAREGIFHHVPVTLPALLYAKKVQRRAAGAGFEYPHAPGAFADLTDEVEELRRELPKDDPAPETEPDERHFREIGDVLFACVNVARRLNVDPELALRAASDRFRARVVAAERLAREDGLAFAELPLADQDRFFDLAKKVERP